MDNASSKSFCPDCGTRNRPGAAYCPTCGKGITRLCPSCAAVLKAGSRFCAVCGLNLTAAAAPSRTPYSAPGSSYEPSPQGRYSADGAWWWNGTQWVDAQGSAPLAATAATAAATTAAPGPQAARGKGGHGRQLLMLAVLAGAGLGAYGTMLVMNAPAEIQLSGRAFVSTPLTAATVNVYEMRSDGQPGPLLATATTDEDGYYSASVRRSPSSSLLVMTSGGTYIYGQGTPQAGPSDQLKTVLRPGGDHATLTPLTTLAAARVSALAASGKPLDASIEVSYAAVARQFNLETVTDIDPALVSDPEDVQVADRTARQYGLILVGFDAVANALGVTPFVLAGAVAQDLSDGTLDGKNGATPVLIDKRVSLPADAATARLQEAINAFAASPGNLTHLPAPQISLEAPQIDLNTGGLAYVSPNVLPAWIDGRAGKVTISGKGGTLPYTCELASGELPKGFSLSKDCTISGNGTPVLGTSTMLITTPFTVRMSDASQPPQSVSFDLRITILAKSPVIAVSSGTCPQAGKACSVTVASATGGTPPYYYKSDSFANGSPPLGMIVNLKGALTGKPARAGTYTVGVCVVDLVGASDCAATKVTVGDGSSAAPTKNNLPAGFPTDLPSGTYKFSVCIDIPGAAAYSSCVDAGTYVMSGDAGAFAQTVSQTADAIRSGCSCSVRYSTFNGAYFDFVITDTNTGTVTRIRITKVG